MRLSRPTSTLSWFVWHGVAAFVVTLLPSQLWLGRDELLHPKFHTFLGAAVLAYVIGALALTLVSRRGAPVAATTLAAATLPGIVLFLLFLIAGAVDFSRVLAVALVGAMAAGYLVPLLPGVPLLSAAGVAATLLGGALVTDVSRDQLEPSYAESTDHRILSTSFYDLLVTSFRNTTGPLEVTGGGLAQVDDRYLLATGDGRLHLLTFDPVSRTLQTDTLALHVPINRDDFIADATGANVDTRLFRTAGILTRRQDEGVRLFVAHHFWHRDGQCATLRVSTLATTTEAIGSLGRDTGWQTLFETKPCLPPKPLGNGFAGHQMGGQMDWLDDRHLVLTVGDHEMEGLFSPPLLTSDPSADYGKILDIDVDTGAASVYSRGHRNPQGLVVAADGRVWETEHGPKGGDELNLIERNADYGWPIVTYGSTYEAPTWPLSPTPGEHTGFRLPIVAWVPSIGVSAATELTGDAFARWKGDLLVGTLNARTLYRARIREGRAVLLEPIALGERVRDILEDPTGRLVIWTEGDFFAPTSSAVVVVERADAVADAVAIDPVLRGQALVTSRCVACHQIDATSPGSSVGPTLVGVAGRAIAAVPEFSYSPALQGVEGRWTESQLDAFLASPERFAAGTSMQFGGIADAAERAAIVAFLETLR